METLALRFLVEWRVILASPAEAGYPPVPPICFQGLSDGAGDRMLNVDKCQQRHEQAQLADAGRGHPWTSYPKGPQNGSQDCARENPASKEAVVGAVVPLGG